MKYLIFLVFIILACSPKEPHFKTNQKVLINFENQQCKGIIQGKSGNLIDGTPIYSVRAKCPLFSTKIILQIKENDLIAYE